MNLYPIGTVVTIKGGSRSVIIYGRKQRCYGDNTIWDYVACLYPEGYIEEAYNVFFQHQDVEQVLHVGYVSEEDQQMQALLAEV